MGRIRSIKPEFWTSEQVMECSRDARLLFIGLWNFADDAGRHPYNPKQIKALVFPGDDDPVAAVEVWLGELLKQGLLSKYEAGGRAYLQITGWHHQKIDRPQKPKYPEQSANPREQSRETDEDSTNARRTLDDHSSVDRIGKDKGRDKGEDRKGEDRKETRANALLLVENSFEQFWDVWPNKVGRPPAERAFAKAFAKHGLETILNGLSRYVRDKPRDRPWLNPATFLNQERFLDSPAPPPEARAGPLTQADVLNELKRKVNGNAEPDQHDIKDVTPGAPEPRGRDSVANLFEPAGRKMAGGTLYDLHASGPDTGGPATLEAKAWRTG